MSNRFTVLGNGAQKVVVAHTWFADHSTFRPMFPYLNLNEFTYAFVDFRGYGGSAHVSGSFTLQEMGQDLLACADELRWEKFHLVGNSMGGQASQWVASHHPHRVVSLVLLSSVPAEGSPLDADTMAFFEKAGAEAGVREMISTTLTGNRYSPSFAKALATLSMETGNKRTLDNYLRVWTSGPSDPSPSLYAGPVKAFVGEFDPVLTLAVTQQTIGQHFSQCEVEVIPGCGHFAAIEVPVLAASRIEAFLSAHAS